MNTNPRSPIFDRFLNLWCVGSAIMLHAGFDQCDTCVGVYVLACTILFPFAKWAHWVLFMIGFLFGAIIIFWTIQLHNAGEIQSYMGNLSIVVVGNTFLNSIIVRFPMNETNGQEDACHCYR
jgi:hypothetical protein